MNGWLCPTINTGLIFAASHSPGRSVGLPSLGEARVSRPRPKWVGPYAARPLFFYALFAASLAKSPSSSLIASHNIRSTVFAPYFWDGAARSGVGSNSSDIVSQRLPWLSVEKTFRIKSFFSWSVDSPAPWLQCSTPEKSAPHGNSSKPNLLGCLNFRRMESARAYADRILQNSS